MMRAVDISTIASSSLFQKYMEQLRAYERFSLEHECFNEIKVFCASRNFYVNKLKYRNLSIIEIGEK